MLKVYKRERDKYWRIRGTVAGKRYEESTGLALKKEAEQLCAVREAELIKAHIEAKITGRPTAPTFAGAVAAYIESGGSPRFLMPLLDVFGERRIDTITQADIDGVARKFFPGGEAATVNRQVYTPMSAVLKAAGAVAEFKRPKDKTAAAAAARMRVLTPVEAQQFIMAAAPHLKPLLVFLLYTGARVGEALWLDWSCVDLERAHVRFPTTKNGKARGLPLHQAAIRALNALPHREGEIFRCPDGNAYSRPKAGDYDDTSAGARIKTAFRSALRRSGLGRLRVHDLRHTWATWHYQQNHDLLALKEAGGWSSLKMVERYAQSNREEFRAHISAFPVLNINAVTEKSAPEKAEPDRATPEEAVG